MWSIVWLGILAGCPHAQSRPVAPRARVETRPAAGPAATATPPAEGPWTTAAPESWTAVPIRNAAAPAPTSRAPRLIELRPTGMVNELGVAPGGAMWITSDENEVFRTDGFDRPWRAAPLDCTGADGRRGRCSRVTFFDDRRAIATGYVGEALNEYFWTDSAGQQWERRTFGEGQWIYDVFVGEGGEAWMGGSHGRLHHTPDYGRTWTLRASPFDHGSRLHRIFFDGQDGVAGALRNEMKTSPDGGRTWDSIDTPLDQRATSGASCDPEADGRIENVALYGDWILVEQCERVFASPRSPVRWRLVDGSPVTFAADRAGRSVFALTRAREVVTIDRQLLVTPLRGHRLREPAIDLHVEDTRLYAIGESYGLHRADANGMLTAALMTDADGPQQISEVRRAGDRLWGRSPNSVYVSDDGGTSWDLQPELPRTLARTTVHPSGAIATRAREALGVLDSPAIHMVDAQHGFFGGYLYHRGDHAWETRNGGVSWEPIDRAVFPYVLVVPWREGRSLAVAGSSFSYEDDNRRALWVLEGTARRRVFVAEHQISDVSVDEQGRILIELDPDPESFPDTRGRYWRELRPRGPAGAPP